MCIAGGCKGYRLRQEATCVIALQKKVEVLRELSLPNVRFRLKQQKFSHSRRMTGIRPDRRMLQQRSRKLHARSEDPNVCKSDISMARKQLVLKLPKIASGAPVLKCLTRAEPPVSGV